MKVQATAKFIRLSPRKARLVVDSIRGLSVLEAEKALTVMNKKGAEPVLKLLKSAIANAEHNFKLSKENLYVAAITANEGMTIKRFTPRAFGRATMVRKRTSHLNIVVDERTPTTEVKPEAKEETAEKNDVVATKTVTEEKPKATVKKKAAPKKEDNKQQS